MASIGSEPGGLRRVLFVAPDGKRRTIRLGRVSIKTAGTVRRHVESLAIAQRLGAEPGEQTLRWLLDIDPETHDKLAAVGLVAKRANSGLAQLGPFLDSYIAGRSDVKPDTRAHFERARRDLTRYFGADKPLGAITAADTDEFRRQLLLRLGENTVRRICGRAKQFFRFAVRKRLIAENPFADMRDCNVQANRSRDYFVTRAEAAKVLDACPDADWRLLFALSRYGGLRCPSEHLALRWGDVDWARNRLTVRSPKTEHHEGKESRVLPLFPELRPHLEAAFDAAEPGTEYVIARHREPNINLRTQLERIIAKAGLAPWPKLFQNLRASRATELAADYPAHVAAAWLGHSTLVAQKHYWQVTDADFEKASSTAEHPAQNPAQNPAQYPPEMARKPSQHNSPIPVFSEDCDGMRYLTSMQATRQGLEP